MNNLKYLFVFGIFHFSPIQGRTRGLRLSLRFFLCCVQEKLHNELKK